MEPDWLRAGVALIAIVLGVWMVARTTVLRRAGVNVNALFSGERNLAATVLIAGAAILDLYILLRWPFPVLDHWVRAGISPSPAAAIIVTCIASLFIAAAQAGMGRSWRIGVPAADNDVDALVMDGLNGFSRNPVYLGVMAFLVGLLLAAPGPLTLASLVISFVGLTIIIENEERYLRNRFGADYDAYARRVRRWF